jgi:hypothetical protein
MAAKQVIPSDANAVVSGREHPHPEATAAGVRQAPETPPGQGRVVCPDVGLVMILIARALRAAKLLVEADTAHEGRENRRR